MFLRRKSGMFIFVYANSKNLGDSRFDKKQDWEKALPQEAWALMLSKIESIKDTNPTWKRDHAAIFLGGALGLRVGECCILERKHFRDLRDHDVIHAPTLKQSQKIAWICSDIQCHKKLKLKSDRAGQMCVCPKCGLASRIPTPKGKLLTGIVERRIDIIESQTANYALDYIENFMRPDQRWLFEGRSRDYHITSGSLNRIFNTFVLSCGLNPRLSFHSLRHMRGVRLWSTLNDMKAVQNGLRHKNIAASQIYADLDEGKKKAYREALEDGAYDPLKKKRTR